MLKSWLRPFLQPVTYLGLVMLICIYAALSYLLVTDRKATEATAVYDNENLVALLNQTIRQTLKRVDNDVLLIRKLYASGPDRFDFSMWAHALKDRGGEDQQYAIIGANGVALFSSGHFADGGRDFADSDFFRAHLDDTDDRVFISAPLVMVPGGDTEVVLSRAIVGPDGRFGGVAAGTIDLHTLNRAYRGMSLGADGFASLWTMDGTVLVSGGNGSSRPELVGQRFPNAGMFDHLAQAARGTYWNTPGQTSSIRAINGTKRLVSYATVDGFPLIASLGRTETEIFRSARADALIYWLIALLVTGCIAVAIAYGARRQRKLDEAAASLERTNARFSLALENMPHGLCMYDFKQRLVIANRRYAEIYRLPTDAIVPGTPLDRILRLRVAGASDGLTERYLRQQSELAASRTPSAVESALNGRTYLVTHQPTADGGALAIHQDVTEQKAAETQIWELAHRDSLTGVTSRLAFLETLRTVIGPQGARPRELAVHIVDIDNFKDINDSLGHPVGDSLLAQIAGRIKSAAGPNVIVGRLGGDEFALLQNPSGAIAREAPLLADRVLAAIRRPYNIDDRLLHVEASIGIAVAPADGSDADRLIKRADLALYNVKAAGRNGYRVFEASMESAVEERLHLTTELRQALVQQEFELDYQPVVALDTRATVSREALLRWNHPLRGRLLPETFIGTAEHSGLIKAIGSWVLHSACREAMRWPDHTRVAVNLSPIQFRDSLFEVVENALRESGLPPQRLELEVTENVLLEYNEQNIRCLDRLRSLGVAIVLDDFGAGYASLGYLRRFRFDRIKIDRSITTGLSREPDLYGILSAITGLARALDVKTIAEGIETEEQLLLLRAAGCDEGQGFLLGRPGPVSASVRRIA